MGIMSYGALLPHFFLVTTPLGRHYEPHFVYLQTEAERGRLPRAMQPVRGRALGCEWRSTPEA